MSDTDDTDDLLLIPPDFFSVQSEPEPPYYAIVDSLIKQVSKLQNRIETIESTSDASFLDNTEEMLGNRKYKSSEDIYVSNSTSSTPQKPPLKPKLNSLPASPNIDKNTFKVNRSASKAPNEVDSFISNVKTIQRNHTVRKLENEFSSNSKKPVDEPLIRKDNTWRCGDNLESIPDYNFGIRSLITNSTNSVDDKSSDSSSDSTLLTAYNKSVHLNALNVLDMHKKMLDITEGRERKKKSINTLSDNLGLLSLADIWGTTHPSLSPSKLNQKLQEEKLRRQHCEQLIQELQNKNLELQQRLAVAVKVDESKSSTIKQFKEALDKVSTRMEKLNTDKSNWDQEILKLKNRHSMEIESAMQKVTFHENEASKALTLAHGNQEKISTLERRCSDLQNELQSIESSFKGVQESYHKESQRNKQLTDIVSQKEVELSESKKILNDVRIEVTQSRKAVDSCQAEMGALKKECMRVHSELRQEKDLTASLSEQKKKLYAEVHMYKSIEKSFKDSLEEARSKLESTKLELRNFYQGQLEIIVENKRKEMQNQLDQERRLTSEEFKRKELSMAKTAANHIKEISEKCALEIKLLEEKHREEVRLYHIQISQLKKEVEHLQSKLASLPEKRAQIAKQLQRVMESQWNEALKMISNSPASFNEPQHFQNFNSFASNLLGKEEQHQTLKPNKDEAMESVSDYDETPISSRGGVKNSESEIQKYINMLLNRPPGNPVTEATGADQQQCERGPWYPDRDNEVRDTEASRGQYRERRNGKPPWK